MLLLQNGIWKWMIKSQSESQFHENKTTAKHFAIHILFGHKGIECVQILCSCVSFCALNLWPFLVKERKMKFVTVSRIKASTHTCMHVHVCARDQGKTDYSIVLLKVTNLSMSESFKHNLSP